ncbi:CysZ protein [Microbacterium sp. W4I4]|uniref:EI24 domain-containing protein n=1 Tax=Microbacterium sp. W4I4 TaxID=3042295 RepID=UPI00277F0285|nr:EI24 domain-containing protein [Microbacterium sp. W4I4]MDQ0615462.1 CysZ protein [Microbacterium sp. W4I4]
MIREFFTGIRFLGRGFGYWRKRPGLMFLGLIPGLIALVLLIAALLPLLLSLGSITEWMTPFADGWDPFWATALRSAVGIVIAIGALVLASVVFTALTLLIGDPFYQRIWRAVENDLGGQVPEGDGGLRVAFGESIRLVALGVLVAILALLIGLIPVVGAVLATVVSILLTGRLLARELTGRALNARDVPSDIRSRIFAARRSRLLGFGVATQLCFMVPLGAVFIMPTAVAGATILARDLLDQPQGPVRA